MSSTSHRKHAVLTGYLKDDLVFLDGMPSAVMWSITMPFTFSPYPSLVKDTTAWLSPAAAEGVLGRYPTVD